MDFNISFSNGFTIAQKDAAIKAAKNIGKYIIDDITLNISFGNTDKFSNNVAAGAFPNSQGTVFYDGDRLVYLDAEDKKAANRLQFGDYLDYLELDATSIRDKRALDTLQSDVVVNTNKNTEHVIYRNVFGLNKKVEQLELTNANAKALNIPGNYGKSDGAILINALDRYSAGGIANSYISEYRELSREGEVYRGNLSLINNSDIDRIDSAYTGNFFLRGAEILKNPDGTYQTEGDLKIVRAIKNEIGTTYVFKSKDDYFLSGEKDQLVYTARDLSGTLDYVSTPTKTRMFSVDFAGDTETQIPYSATNPYHLEQKALVHLFQHEIGHVLGFSSGIEDTPKEYSKYLVNPVNKYSLLNRGEVNFANMQSRGFHPLDLYRYTELADGSMVRSLAPDLTHEQAKGTFFSIDETGTVALSDGRYISTDVLVDYYGQNNYTYNPYLDNLVYNEHYSDQGSHFHNDGVGILSARFDSSDVLEFYTDQDLKVFDVLGYDIDYSGSSSNIVTTNDITSEIIPDLDRALEATRRTRRSVRGGSIQIADNGYLATYEVLGGSEFDYDSLINDFSSFKF